MAGGVVGAEVLSRAWYQPAWRGLALAFFTVCLFCSLRFPPSHASSFSTVEDELIDVARSVADRVQHRQEELPLTIFMRPFTGFHGDQGDPLAAAVGESPRVSTIVVGPETVWAKVLQPRRQYLVLMDRIPFSDDWSPGLFAHIQPAQVNHYLEAHHRLFPLNKKVQEWLDGLPSDQWARERMPTTAGLDAIRVQPTTPL